LMKERHQQMLGVQLLMTVLAGQPLGPLQGLLGLDRVAIALHGSNPSGLLGEEASTAWFRGNAGGRLHRPVEERPDDRHRAGVDGLAPEVASDPVAPDRGGSSNFTRPRESGNLAA